MPRNNKSKNVNEISDDSQQDIISADTPDYTVDEQYDVADTSSENVSKIDDDDDDEQEQEQEQELIMDKELDAGDESDDSDSNKKKDKKHKESFKSLNLRIDSARDIIKSINKEINELEKNIKIKEKERSEHERQLNSALKLIGKTHLDEVTKAKIRPKRKGNVNGGFNKEQPVPEILRNFLGLPENAAMSRPKVMSALNNKFKELGLKDGQLTTIDKETAIALNLTNSDGKVIKFTEFQTFLTSFYPPKAEIESVI
jgi:hypothetical protein